MGLDMYLYEEKYIGAYLHKQNADGGYTAIRATDAEITIKRTFKDNGKKEVKTEKYKPDFDICGARLSLPLFYWRKANAIHAYFVDKCGNGEDNCQRISVPYEDLKELGDRCHRILKDHSLAEELLPTRSGFFFGSTEYDDYYFEDLKATAEMIDKLKPDDYETDYWYQASW